jgi:DNA-binding beta-propeller fold protein YncE
MNYRRIIPLVSILVLAVSVVAVAASKLMANETIETLAGTGRGDDDADGGAALETNLGHPFGVQIGPDGGLYICEFGSHRIRRLDLKTKNITNIAGIGKAGFSGDGGAATQAALNQPHELRFDAEGNLYFADMRNHAVRRIDRRGIITTVAGNGRSGFAGDGGPAENSQLNQPHSICFSADKLYVADVGNHRVRAIDLKTSKIETVAGTGAKRLPNDGGAAREEPLFGPRAVCVQDNYLWIALREGHSVWKVDLKRGTIRHVSGNGKPGFADGGRSKSQVNSPKGIDLGPDGKIYLVDSSNHCIRRVDPKTHVIETIAGKGETRGFSGDGGHPTAALLNNPHGVGFGDAGEIYIGDSDNHRVRVIRRSK